MNPDLDLNNWLKCVWSLDFFEDMMATNNSVMQDQILNQYKPQPYEELVIILHRGMNTVRD